MSYCYSYSGEIRTKDMPEDVVRKANELFDYAFYDAGCTGNFNERLEFDGFCKYDDEAIDAFFKFTAPYTTDGYISCAGEDNTLWVYKFNYPTKTWVTYDGVTVYPQKDEQVYCLSEWDRGLIYGLLINTDLSDIDATEQKRLNALKVKFRRNPA